MFMRANLLFCTGGARSKVDLRFSAINSLPHYFSEPGCELEVWNASLFGKLIRVWRRIVVISKGEHKNQPKRDGHYPQCDLAPFDRYCESN
jgi:hypothetical protein